MTQKIKNIFVALIIVTSLSACAESFVVTQSICDITSEICYYSESICNLVNNDKINKSDISINSDLKDISNTLQLHQAVFKSNNDVLTESELQDLKKDLIDVKDKLQRVYKRAHKLE